MIKNINIFILAYNASILSSDVSLVDNCALFSSGKAQRADYHFSEVTNWICNSSVWIKMCWSKHSVVGW